MHGAGGLWIERELELFFPVEKEARVAERVVPIARSGAMTRDVGGMRGNFVSDHALANVVGVRQAEMFFRRDVAEHRRAMPSDHGGANRAGDVVVAGSDIRDKRAKRVERGFVAQLHFLVDLQLDLVHGDVAGAFDHHLHIVFPGLFGELAEDAEFGKLSFIARVGEATGTQAVSEREAHVVLLKNLADGIEVFIQEILFFVKAHPLREQRAAAADDSGDAIAYQRKRSAQHAGMDSHVIDALLGLFFDHLEHHVDVQILGAADARNRFVDWDGADGDGRGVDDGLADRRNIAASGESHYGVRAVVDGAMKLFEFVTDVRRGGGVADIRVDFAAERDADAHGFEITVIHVGRDDGAAAGDFVANEFGRELLAPGDVVHFLGDDALPRKMHLRKIAHATIQGGRTLFDPAISESHDFLRPRKPKNTDDRDEDRRND